VSASNIYGQNFVLGKEKPEGDTETCQAKKIINPLFFFTDDQILTILSDL
jgi:hypothetical protein